MHNSKMLEIVLENKSHIDYSFKSKEAYLAVFFSTDDTRLKDSLVCAMDNINIPTINNTTTSTILFKLASEHDAEGLQSHIQTIFDKLEYEEVSSPFQEKDPNWLMPINKLMESFIGMYVFEDAIPNNVELEKKHKELIGEKLENGIFGFNELRKFKVENHYGDMLDKIVNDIVDFTMKETNFFKSEEDLKVFLYKSIEELKKAEYKQAAFEHFRLSKFAEQIKYRLERTNNEKVVFESVFKKACQNNGRSNSERMYPLLSIYDWVSNIPTELFASLTVEQKSSSDYLLMKEIPCDSFEAHYDRKTDFKRAYFKQYYKIAQTARVNTMHQSDYVEALKNVLVYYFTVVEGLTLLSKLKKSSSYVYGKTFNEFIQSFDI